MRGLIAATALALTGCATAPQITTVPVARPCPAAQERPARPELPIKHINNTDAPNVVVKAYASSVELLKGYAEALEEKLDACK